MIATISSAILLFLALVGQFRMRPHGLPALFVGLYWIPSWIAHTLAFPLCLVSIGLSVWQWRDSPDLGIGLAMAAIAALVFLLIHLRNRRDGQRMLEEAGSNERISLLAGLWPASSSSGTQRIRNISYGEHGADTLLDIVAPVQKPSSPMPVLIHIHGGAWVIGRKDQQSKPLLRHMARNGWLCLDINYRLGPDQRFPVMITDTLRAIAWAREHVAEYGGDPARMFLTGGSAGGHLSALATLAHDDASLKPGFEDADCSVSGAVPLYGRYDFIDRRGNWGRNHDALIEWKTAKVMPCPPVQDPQIWDKASPLVQVRPDAPPMWIVHGRHDALLHYEDAAQFAQALRDAGADARYTELAGGQHAYDIYTSALTAGHVRAVHHWLSVIAAKSEA